MELAILSSQRTHLLQSLVLEIPWNRVGGVPESDRMSGGLENWNLEKKEESLFVLCKYHNTKERVLSSIKSFNIEAYQRHKLKIKCERLT